MTLLSFLNCLVEYHYWANQRILRTAANLSEAQFTARVFPHHNSLRGTLVHTLSAEWIWLERWHGVSPRTTLREEDWATLDSIRERWRQEEARLRGLLARSSDEDLLRIVSYTNLSGKAFARPLWQLMAHVVNHGTQHRAEAAAMLTELGHSPGDMDLSLFLSEWSPTGAGQ
jgi:uncharacterized damage-inducible protein DinB